MITHLKRLVSKKNLATYLPVQTYRLFLLFAWFIFYGFSMVYYWILRLTSRLSFPTLFLILPIITSYQRHAQLSCKVRDNPPDLNSCPNMVGGWWPPWPRTPHVKLVTRSSTHTLHTLTVSNNPWSYTHVRIWQPMSTRAKNVQTDIWIKELSTSTNEKLIFPRHNLFNPCCISRSNIAPSPLIYQFLTLRF